MVSFSSHRRSEVSMTPLVKFDPPARLQGEETRPKKSMTPFKSMTSPKKLDPLPGPGCTGGGQTKIKYILLKMYDPPPPKKLDPPPIGPGCKGGTRLTKKYNPL